MRSHNNSAWLGYLEPMRDAKEVLLQIKREGWEIHGCTAMGFDPYAISLRKNNLETHFPNVFDRLDTVGFGASKESWLEKYRGKDCVWVEDRISNAQLGASMGFKTFLMKQQYNARCDDTRITKVDNWQQIHYYINK
jgi:beta-phosphoglucomutase-like phosphatase (HAD superfamily)